ncbi:MAG: extracellular solute-binding protein [Acidobacteria bacterium]|nr:extracellular solute-binding protein [Acidobacteriota bacterium]
MAHTSVRAALISGGMYDRLYERIPEFEREAGVRVEIAFRGNHPELNAHLAACGAEAPYDLVSTHTKYAPSQQHLLATLEDFDTGDFFPRLLEMASIGGALYAIPRNIDLRLLHYRTDAIATPPATWDDLVRVARQVTRAPEMYGFALTGIESGMFGTFFELAEAGGARIFPESLVAEVNNPGGRWALGVLRELYGSGAVPPAAAGWHYDEAHQCFREGRAAMTSDWPGYWGSYRDPSSPVRGRFAVARMPAGPGGRVFCYAGSHTFALTRAGGRNPGARELLRFLTAPEQQALEARQGSVAVRRGVMERQRSTAAEDEAARLDLLAHSIEHDLIVPPKLPYYPRIEEILWRNVRAAMLGEVEIPEALAGIEARIAECVADAA